MSITKDLLHFCTPETIKQIAGDIAQFIEENEHLPDSEKPSDLKWAENQLYAIRVYYKNLTGEYLTTLTKTK